MRLEDTISRLPMDSAFQESYNKHWEEKKERYRAYNETTKGRRPLSERSLNTKDHYQEMKARKELITDNPEASCLHCGTHEDLQVAHRVARALGGSYDRENLMVLCAPCHLRYDHQTPILRSYGRYAADSYAAYRLSSDAGTETATGAGAIG